MFATCLHCHSSLGANELIEHFPIGRRLAFDSAKGRLWVVCTKCRRWNLTPLEERWEAIEECERFYSGTTLRASTDNIGLARLADGLDVVRIGTPKTPEMAAWRYARDFGRRWVQNGIPLAFMAGGGFQIMNQMLTTGHDDSMLLFMLTVGAAGVLASRLTGRRARMALPNGKVRTLGPHLHRHVRLVPASDGWALNTGDPNDPDVVAPHAVPGLRAVMTSRNYAGAPRPDIEAAISHLADARDPRRFITRLARASDHTGIHTYPPDIALALEMALHEDSERQALEGELSQLRGEWELAEEIAHIADNILLPASVRERFASLQRQAQP